MLRALGWSTSRLGTLKLKEAGESVSLREQEERRDRERWMEQLQELLVEAQLPVAKSVRPGGEMLLTRVAKGRRPATLRKHVKTWHKVRLWMLHTFEDATQMALFIEAMISEPCSRTFPGSVYRTLMFLEHSGEVDEVDFIHRAPAVRNAVEEGVMRLEEGDLKVRRQSHALLVAVIMAMETCVCDERHPDYVRCYSWFRLIKLWTAMRFGDTQGVPMRTASMEDWGWRAEIHRSKASGPGKKVAVLPIFVSKDAWLGRKGWLRIGGQIWKRLGVESGMQARDFLLPAPNRSLTGFVRKVVSYPVASAMSQALFAGLDHFQGGRRSKLMEESLGTIWTEHSERSTLRSWAHAARVAGDIRKLLGRWQQTVDEGYERTARVSVLEAQKGMAVFIRENLGKQDPVDETAVLNLVAKRLEVLGKDDEVKDSQVGRLMSFLPIGMGASSAKVPSWGSDDLRAEREPDTSPADSDGEWSEPEGCVLDEEKGTTAEELRGQYVISIVGRSRTMTLHRVGECHRIPGVHYASFEVCGTEVPDAGRYHRACRPCFAKGGPLVRRPDDDSSGEVSSSESASGEEWQTAVTRENGRMAR